MKLIRVITVLLIVTACSVFADKTVTSRSYIFTIPDEVVYEVMDERDYCTFSWEDSYFCLYPVPHEQYGLRDDLFRNSKPTEQGSFKGIEANRTETNKNGSISHFYGYRLIDNHHRRWEACLISATTNDINTASMLLRNAKSSIKPFVQTLSNDAKLNIAETTFLYMFNKNGMLNKTDQTCFISLFKEDPPPSFMSRFRKEERINPGSKFVAKTGVKFGISSIEQISATEVEVRGRVYRTPLSAYWAIYILTEENGSWRVTDQIITMKS